MTNQKYNTVVILLILFTISYGQANKPFLSNLKATKDSPLYTTYAAQMERSEFILDEGFHFLYYDPEKGIDFTTDTAGDLCVAFKRGADYVYLLKDMYKEPEIHTSYTDIVKYNCFPFADIQVDATFFVYSSRIAIHDLIIRNIGDVSIDLKVYPFIQNNYRVFNTVNFHHDLNKITFKHKELPDSWVLSHNIPYVDEVSNVFLLSERPDRMASFRSYKWGNVSIPLQIDLQKKQNYVVWGAMNHDDGGRCLHHNPTPKMMIILNNNRSRILTETAPRWERSDKNINPYGFYNVELGNFGEIKKGDHYEISLFCKENNQAVVIKGEVLNPDSANAERCNVVFRRNDLLPTPINFKKDVWGSGTEIRLYWDEMGKNTFFNVYRRDYRKHGVYQCIAEKVKRTFYTDKNIQGDQLYGYIVTAMDEQGNMSMPTDEITNIFGSDFLTDVKYPDQIKTDVSDLVRVIAMQKNITLLPGAEKHLRIIRGFAKDSVDLSRISQQTQELLQEDLGKYISYNEKIYSNIPQYDSGVVEKDMLYWNAWTLMRQVMLPPENKCNNNYYVFSREPTWGWGHGGQVFHESLTMHAYAHMDAKSAMNSQRIYLARQQENGYINYRTGPYLDEVIEVNGELTSSAPWYAWQNWEIYRITGDKQFLEEMYQSSKRFYTYYTSNRDKDGDGLYEWGAHAVLESVRDARVAVWDEVGWPTNFEAVDLNCMLVKEAKAMAAMADELGKKGEAEQWRIQADKHTELINNTFWDEETAFYYHVDKKDNDFSFNTEMDLKRQEIIGFLPLWAGVATKEQAHQLLSHLLNPSKFWREFGVPSLAADDPYYNPKGYWNGPVWVEWNYLILEGLLQYGFVNEAKILVDRVAENMITQLKKDHNFWEFYSPDENWAGYHKTYIWAGIINRMLLDVASL